MQWFIKAAIAAGLFFIGLGEAQAYFEMNGVFVADDRCAAYVSIKRQTNPGRVRTMPGTSYTVHGLNQEDGDFVHVDDVAGAVLQCVDSPVATGVTLNVWSGVASSILEVARLLSRIMASSIEPHVTAGEIWGAEDFRQALESQPTRYQATHVPPREGAGGPDVSIPSIGAGAFLGASAVAIGRAFQQRIAFKLALHIGGEVEIRELQQLDGLHQLRRHHERVALPEFESLAQCHIAMHKWSGSCLPRLGGSVQPVSCKSFASR